MFTTPWEYFIGITWTFFIMAWCMRYIAWTVGASTVWIKIALGGSPNGVEKDN